MKILEEIIRDENNEIQSRKFFGSFYEDSLLNQIKFKKKVYNPDKDYQIIEIEEIFSEENTDKLMNELIKFPDYLSFRVNLSKNGEIKDTYLIPTSKEIDYNLEESVKTYKEFNFSLVTIKGNKFDGCESLNEVYEIAKSVYMKRKYMND